MARWRNEQLEVLESKMSKATEAARVASDARTSAFEQGTQSELETFTPKFSQAAHNVDGAVSALDRKLTSSVGTLTHAIEGGDSTRRCKQRSSPST